MVFVVQYNGTNVAKGISMQNPGMFQILTSVAAEINNAGNVGGAAGGGVGVPPVPAFVGGVGQLAIYALGPNAFPGFTPNTRINMATWVNTLTVAEMVILFILTHLFLKTLLKNLLLTLPNMHVNLAVQGNHPQGTRRLHVSNLQSIHFQFESSCCSDKIKNDRAMWKTI